MWISSVLTAIFAVQASVASIYDCWDQDKLNRMQFPLSHRKNLCLISLGPKGLVNNKFANLGYCRGSQRSLFGKVFKAPQMFDATTIQRARGSQ